MTFIRREAIEFRGPVAPRRPVTPTESTQVTPEQPPVRMRRGHPSELEIPRGGDVMKCRADDPLPRPGSIHLPPTRPEDVRKVRADDPLPQPLPLGAIQDRLRKLVADDPTPRPGRN